MTPRTRRLVAAAALAVGVGVGVLFLAGLARHVRYGDSDNANALLAGHAMIGTNPLLSGWDLPHDSYWLIDLPLYGLGSVIFGLREGLLSAVPAVVDVALIGTGAVVAGLGFQGTGRRRWWAGAAVVAVLLGLPHAFLATYLLQSPHHVATCLLCLVALARLAGAGLGDRRWVAGSVLLAVTAHSDPLALAVGVGPVAGAGVLDALRRRRAAALPGPLAAAAGALAGAFLIGVVLRLAGGFRPLPDPAAVGHWGESLGAVPRILGGLLGVSGQAGLHGGARLAHAVGAGLFLAGLAATAGRSLLTLVRPAGGVPAADGAADGTTGERRRLGRGGGRFGPPGGGFLDDALLLGCVGGVVVYAALTDAPVQVPNARYLLPTIVFGAVLAARRTIEAAGRTPGPALAVAAVAFAAAYGATPISLLDRPVPTNPSVALAGWLEARGLRHGYGQDRVAGLTTVSAGEAVAVRPVFNDHGRLRPYEHFAARRWFEDSPPFRFVVVDRTFPEAVDEPAAVDTFGPPAEAQDVGRYRVLIWDRNLPALPAP